MTTASSAIRLVYVALAVAAATAFAPSSRRSATISYTPARITKSAGPRFFPGTILDMNAESEGERPKDQEKQVSADGTFYDDETPQYRDPLSDNMRARLMKEASTGLDADKKQTNVILYISIAVMILVLLGGQGILY